MGSASAPMFSRRAHALAVLDDARVAWVAAEAIRAAPKDPWQQRRTDEIAAAKRRLLDGAIGMALSVGVSVEEAADVAGVPVSEVELVLRRLPAG